MIINMFQPKEKLMESVDKELSKSIQRHLNSSKLNTEVAVFNKLLDAKGPPIFWGATYCYRFFDDVDIQILYFCSCNE